MHAIDSFMNNLGEGWTIYIWLISGVMIVVAAMIGMRWAYKNQQFDEDIKYVVFHEEDKDNMDPEEFKKSQEVMAKQMKLREEVLEKQRQEYEEHHKKKG